MEIVQERLEREFGLSLLITSPTVIYHITTTKGEIIKIENPAQLPEPTEIEYVEEPYILATIIIPKDYIGNVMKLSLERRGIQKAMEPAPKRPFRLLSMQLKAAIQLL